MKIRIAIILGAFLLSIQSFFAQVATDNPEPSILLERYSQQTTERDRATLATEVSDAYYEQKRHKASIEYARISLGHAKKTNDDLLLAEAYFSLFSNKLWLEKDSIDYFAEWAEFYFIRAEKTGRLVDINNEIGYHKARYQDCAGAFVYLAKADSIGQLHGLTLQQRIRSRIRYCNILIQCEQFDRVSRLAHDILPEVIEKGEFKQRYWFYDVLMLSNAQSGQFDSAVYYLQKGEALLPLIDRPDEYSMFYSNASAVYRMSGDMKKSYEILRDALAFDRKIDSPDRLAGTLYNIGLTCMEIGRYHEGITYIEEAVLYYRGINDAATLEWLYGGLVKGYTSIGVSERAVHYLSLNDNLRDSLREARHQENIEEISMKYEIERVDRELLESKLSLAESEKLAARNRNIGLILAGLLAFGILFFFYLRARRYRKQLEYDKRQAELRYSLLRAQMNPHFIFNSLNSIQSFFSNQRFGQGNEFLGTFSQLVRRVLEQTGQKIISLEEELETLTMYLELEKIRLGTRLDFTVHMDPDLESELIRVPPLIFQPFVENAIWHGIAPKNGPGKIDIYIDYSEKEDLLLCRIEDDGIGMTNKQDRQNAHRSRGVEITRERLGKGGKIDISDHHAAGKTGVRTELVIPLWD